VAILPRARAVGEPCASTFRERTPLHLHDALTPQVNVATCPGMPLAGNAFPIDCRQAEL